MVCESLTDARKVDLDVDFDGFEIRSRSNSREEEDLGGDDGSGGDDDLLRRGGEVPRGVD